jgi:BirA family transcriptional regulator, biotin operon repressor / biotin---[acetyl-CoA-carboxylase] ligase
LVSEKLPGCAVFRNSMLDLDRIRTALDGAPIGHSLDYHTSVPSTMPIAHEWARQPGTRSGMVVVAEEQTSGRGRFLRRWETPYGTALLLSILLKPPWLVAPIEWPLRTGLGVVQALEQTFPPLRGQVGLKWPNDVLLGHERSTASKVAGILIENEWRGSELAHVVIGIGVNVNQLASQLPVPQPGAPPPTSVRVILNVMGELDRTALLIELCQALGNQLINAGESSNLHQKWQTYLWTLGQWVDVYEGNLLVWQGRAVATDQEGALLVVAGTGEARRFIAGEVTVRSAASSP